MENSEQKKEYYFHTLLFKNTHGANNKCSTVIIVMFVQEITMTAKLLLFF